MRKIVIIDDESLILESLLKTIDWAVCGCEVVASADNGIDGCKLIATHLPDIVISDIIMPGKNGIEVAEYCAKMHPKTKVVLLSAHADFSYAQQAIKFGISNYILKPIDTKKLLEAVSRAAAELQNNEKFAENLDKLKQQANAAKSIVSTSLLFDIARYGRNISQQEQKLLLQSGNFTSGIVIALEIFNNPIETNLQIHSIYELIKRLFLENGYETILSTANENRHVFICIIPKNEEKTKAYNRIIAIIKKLNNELELSSGIPVIAVGKIYNDFEFIHQSYEICMKRLDEGFFCTKQTILEGEAKETKEEEPLDISQIIYYMEHGNLKNMQNSLLEIKNKITQSASKEFAIYMLRLLQRTAVLKASNLGLWNKPSRAVKSSNDNFEAMFCYVAELLFSICLYKEKTLNLIGRLEMFINENYSNPELNLTMLSKNLYANSSYLSRLFKKEFKENFSDYLSKIRIERAKFLLETTRLKNGDIAKQIGFEDDHYFSQVFKRKTSYTPKQYREICEKQEKTLNEV